MALLARNNSVFNTTVRGPISCKTYGATLDFGQLVKSSLQGYIKGARYITGTYSSGTDRTIKTIFVGSYKLQAQKKLQALISKSNSQTDIDSLTATAEYVLDAIAEFGPEVIPLNSLVADNVQGEHLATMLRTAYDWKSEVAGWSDALAIAKDALSHEGIDPEDALYGMI